MLGKLGASLVDFVYPLTCVGCGKMGVDFCSICKQELEKVEQICPMCGKENIGGSVHKMCAKKLGIDGLTAVYTHDEKVMSGLIYRVRFEFNKELLKKFVGLLDFEVGKRFDMVVPVPLSIYRRNWRGFNQAKVIANEAGGQLSRPRVEGGRPNLLVVECLKRVRNTKQQSKIKDRKSRLENVRGIFEITSDVEGKIVLLVDDVFTSGATMREATKVLKRAGAKFVWGLVLARRV